jgi:hypothetical protein
VALAIGVIEYRIVTVDVVTAGEIELGEAVITKECDTTDV